MPSSMPGVQLALSFVGVVDLGTAFPFFLHLGSFFCTARVDVLFLWGVPVPPLPALVVTLLGLWAVIWLFCITNRR